jgi:glutamate carboxypeptidase
MQAGHRLCRKHLAVTPVTNIWPDMSSFLHDRVDSDAILEDIRSIVEIESPSRNVAGVNRVLEAITGFFDGTGAVCERQPTIDALGDILRVRCDPTRNEPGILVLSHMDTVHPLGALAGKLAWRRDGDRVYGPGIYDMKGGLVLAVAAYRRIARARRRTPLPITFLFTPDEELSSPGSRSFIEREARGHRYVLVTEPARDGGKVVTARKGIGVFIICTHGRPAHAGANPDKGRNAIAAMAELVLAIERCNDRARGITTNVGLINGGTARNTVAEDCVIEVDLRFCDRASASEMEARILALASSRPDIETTVTGKITRPPFARDRGVDLVFDQAAGIAKEIGFTLESAALVGGGSDGNFTVDMGIPTLDGLGVDGDGAHTNHEHLEYSSIEPRTRLLQGLMERLE